MRACQRQMVSDVTVINGEHCKIMEKFELWRSGMEYKGLRVNMDKTKILVCHAKPVQSGKPSGKWPCGVCGERGWPKLHSLHSVWEVDT